MLLRPRRPGSRFQLEERFLTPKEAGEVLGMSPRTLDRYRSVKRGPAYYKFGSKVRYKMEDLHAWAARQRVNKPKQPKVQAASAED